MITSALLSRGHHDRYNSLSFSSWITYSVQAPALLSSNYKCHDSSQSQLNVVIESSRVMSIGSTSVDAILNLSPGFLLGSKLWAPEEDIKVGCFSSILQQLLTPSSYFSIFTLSSSRNVVQTPHHHCYHLCCLHCPRRSGRTDNRPSCHQYQHCGYTLRPDKHADFKSLPNYTPG